MQSRDNSRGEGLDSIGLGGDDPTQTLPAVTADGADGSDEGGKKKSKKGLAGTRLVALVAIVAVLALALGAILMRFVISPADLAAQTEPPEAGPVSVPIESRMIENKVTIRGEVTYADSVEAEVEISGMSERAVITGRIPESGAELKAGDIALEIAGRPVVVLPGALPAYRTLSMGMKGPDVVQLKKALKKLGYKIKSTKDTEFDSTTADAIKQLYDKLGYPAPTGGKEAQDEVKAATAGVRSAETGLKDAQDELKTAKSELAKAKAPRSAIIEAENSVREAERGLKAERSDPGTTDRDVAGWKDEIRLREARLDEAKKPDTSAQKAAVKSAEQGIKDAARALKEAKDSLKEAQKGTSARMPAEEIMYLSNLPRRVDYVNVSRGDILSGSAMSVSGATLQIKGTAAPQDAQLLKVGTEATFQAPDGTELPAKVVSVKAPSRGGSSGGGEGGEGGEGEGGESGGGNDGGGSGDRWDVVLEPGELTSDQIEMLRQTNVRVSMSVAATDGEVLAVPVAALSAGTGGESRVELAPENPKDEPIVVPVTTGLSAEGYVEISSDDPRIVVGAKVVVGR